MSKDGKKAVVVYFKVPVLSQQSESNENKVTKEQYIHSSFLAQDARIISFLKNVQ